MIDGNSAKNILVKAKKSKEKLSEAIQLFQSFLNAEGSGELPKYYLARNRLKDGQALLDEALADAKQLLGPPPEYASAKITETRTKLLRDSHVLVESPSMDGLEAELLADEYIQSFMNSDKVVHYVREAGTYQTAGKRKLQNIKVRMLIDELVTLAAAARSLQQKAGDKIQSA